jgi:hypothetical protein
MTEPDEALEGFRKWASIRYPKVAAYIEAGACDGDDTAQAYRAGQAASAERIKALEEELARLKELALPPPAPATTPGPWRADQ